MGKILYANKIGLRFGKNAGDLVKKINCSGIRVKPAQRSDYCSQPYLSEGHPDRPCQFDPVPERENYYPG